MSARCPEPRRCAVCGRPEEARFKPFCSKRCADVDLARWLNGAYAIPAEEPPDGFAGDSAGADDAAG